MSKVVSPPAPDSCRREYDDLFEGGEDGFVGQALSTGAFAMPKSMTLGFPASQAH